MTLRLPATLVAGLVLAAAGCGDDGGSSGSEASPTEAVPTTVQTTGGGDTVPTDTGTTATGETTGYHIWFTKNGTLQPIWLEGEKTLGVLTQSMKLLLAGPPSGSGLETAIPDGVEVRDLGFANGTATVDLSAPPLAARDKTLVSVGQIVYTLTQYPTVKRVEIKVDGAGLGVGGSSADVFKRGPFWEEFLPAIVVLTPTGLDLVKSPLTVTGTADVFEANVTIKVLDEDGNELASTFTTATCGTGCRGTFSKRVSFDTEPGAKITLVLADDDADGDGKPSHEVKIPLVVG
jgi:hypothetical protein